MSMIPKVSVVIPVYNAEKYLKRCMDSVHEQTLQEIEIILVDDGATDTSGMMCDAYAKKYENVRVIHQENGGLTSAWKAGSKEAAGIYIGYVDSDDYIAEDMYQRLYDRGVSEDADIVCCGLTHVYENSNRVSWNEEMDVQKDSYTIEEMEQELFPACINDGSFMGRKLQPNRVTKIVKRRLVLQNLELCDERVTVGEDYQFTLAVFLDAKKISIIRNYCPYTYWMNEQSMTGQYDNAYMDKIKLMKHRLCCISDNKKKYDFKPQIINDFLCLTILEIKGEIVKNIKSGYAVNKRDMKRICTDTEVKHALSVYHMPKLMLTEKLFIFFMKHNMYLLMYLCVRIYFKA